MKSERSVSVMTQNIPEIYGSLVFNDKDYAQQIA